MSSYRNSNGTQSVTRIDPRVMVPTANLCDHEGCRRFRAPRSKLCVDHKAEARAEATQRLIRASVERTAERVRWQRVRHELASTTERSNLTRLRIRLTELEKVEKRAIEKLRKVRENVRRTISEVEAAEKALEAKKAEISAKMKGFGA